MREGDTVYRWGDEVICDACVYGYVRAHARVATRQGFLREGVR